MEKPSIRAVYSPRESPDLPYQHNGILARNIILMVTSVAVGMPLNEKPSQVQNVD